MTDPNGAIYGVPWIPSIYPSYVSIYTSTMDPMGWVFLLICDADAAGDGLLCVSLWMDFETTAAGILKFSKFEAKSQCYQFIKNAETLSGGTLDSWSDRRNQKFPWQSRSTKKVSCRFSVTLVVLVLSMYSNQVATYVWSRKSTTGIGSGYVQQKVETDILMISDISIGMKQKVTKRHRKQTYIPPLLWSRTPVYMGADCKCKPKNYERATSAILKPCDAIDRRLVRDWDKHLL